MKGKDNRIVTISLPLENSEVIVFNANLSYLENLYKEAVEKNLKTISITVGETSGELSIKTLRRIIMLSIKLYKSYGLISFALKEYLTYNYSGITEKIDGRDQELDRIWTYLTSQQKNNAILIGEHGVGKTTIASEIIRQINLGECPKQFRKYHVITVNTGSLLELADLCEKKKSFKYEKVLNKLEDFIKQNKERVIFYIDNLLHMKYDIGLLKLFKKCVLEYNIKFIASINDEDFEYYFEYDDDILKYLNRIRIDEPEVDEVYPMIKNRINNLQSVYGVKISEEMIRFAISTADAHAHFNKSNPEKTIDAINFALADAQKNRQKEVTKQNFFTYYRVDFRTTCKRPEKEEWAVSYHEVGHYLVGVLLPNLKCYRFDNVSILPTDDWNGVTIYNFDQRQYYPGSREYFIDDIAFSLGGRVGEKYYTNELSSGASADLLSANYMAEQAVLSLGLAQIGSEENKTYIAKGYVKDYLLTDDVKTKINAEIEKIMKEAYARAQKVIEDNKELFEEIVQRLHDEKILVTYELDEICKKYIKNVDNS